MVFGIFGLEFLKNIPPHGVQSFGSFLEDLGSNEFNKILGHCASGNDKHFILPVI
jgi:hypothetical protein